MKKFLILLLLVTLCLRSQAQYNCTVIASEQGSVTYRVTGYGKNVKTASADAELSAVKALCFLGAEGTIYQLPIVSQGQSKAENAHPAFFESFYGGNYKNFIETSSIVTPFGKDAAKRKCVTHDVRVRASQLRSHLERSGIIRKFGL